MNRDGASISLWQNTAAAYTPKTATIPNQVFDVVLVGGGITGIVTGLLLQKRGKKCLIAEAYNIGFGTTGGTTAHLNTFMDSTYAQIKKDFGEENAQLLYKAARQALDLVKQNVDEYKIDCGHEEKDGYVYAQNDDQVKELEEMLEASQQVGAAVELTDHIPVPIEFQKAIVYHRQAQFHPTKYIAALAQAFEESGGVILDHCKITSVEDKEPLAIESTLGNITAHKLIYATHIPPGINLLHFRCAPYRSYAMALTLTNDQYPTDLAYDMYDPYHYYRTQEVDGKKYLIAGGEDHKTGHEENTEACFTHLESYLRKYFSIDQIAYKWSSQYFEPADGLPYIGKLPGSSENILVATGYGGNGMTYSHIAATLLCDLLTTGSSDYEELFSPSRVKIVAGFANFVKENADVVSQFFGKRIGQEKLESLAALAPGEAKVVKFENESIALYKDDNGGLHAVNPVCTHAKCIVGWNNAEKTWDCPCHGGRFSPEGKVLTGPPRADLEVISLSEITNK